MIFPVPTQVTLPLWLILAWFTKTVLVFCCVTTWTRLVATVLTCLPQGHLLVPDRNNAFHGTVPGLLSHFMQLPLGTFRVSPLQRGSCSPTLSEASLVDLHGSRHYPCLSQWSRCFMTSRTFSLFTMVSPDLQECLEHSKCSIHICWVNEWINWALKNYFL